MKWASQSYRFDGGPTPAKASGGWRSTELLGPKEPRHRRWEITAKPKANVHFQIQQQVNFGDTHRIVGSIRELGKWNIENAPAMAWNDGDVWTLDVELPSASAVEFKCVRVNNGHVEWEGCSNRALELPNGATSEVRVEFSWNQEDLVIDASDSSSSSESAAAAMSNGSAAEVQSDLPESPEALKDREPDVAARAAEDDRPENLRWQGRETSFMRSNEHSRERSGVWDDAALEGAAKALVQGDKEAASWLKKMQVVKELLVDKAKKFPDLDSLASAFIYLQWINTGAVECHEGGGHFRPNKHAELAREIFKVLERAIGDDKVDPLLRLLARKTQTKCALFQCADLTEMLPAFSEQFTQSTPLTRIRDIAHRNDIPHELKQEIKHTIQNKLHRNAGPEDLVATETMLQRVTSDDSSYSADFIQEFKVFTAELRDFFNASSFTDMLGSLKPSLEEEEQKVIDSFLAAKQKADDGGSQGGSLNDIVGALHSLTSVRALLMSKLSSGLRNDAPDASIAMRQKFRLSEIRAEDYAFVLLSRVLNVLEEQVTFEPPQKARQLQQGEGAAEALAAGSDSSWALPLGAAVLSVRHTGLASWQQPECMALENELGAWQQSGGFQQKEHALRLKATLERTQRLTQSFTDALLSVFPKRVEALGKALGIANDRIQLLKAYVVRVMNKQNSRLLHTNLVFTESEVRASLMFQLSKLCSLLIKATRITTGGGAWDALVAGEASGRLIEVERIEAGAVNETKEPVVLLVKQASGDEEIGACGLNLRGVILSHSLPHLSHLGVRARQGKVVFVTCEDESTLEAEVRPLLGSQVMLSAKAESVTIGRTDQTESPAVKTSAAERGVGKPRSEKVEKVTSGTVLPLQDARIEDCGSKSAACGRLARVAQESGLFQAAAGVCLPFGNMSVALQDSKKEEEFAKFVRASETADSSSGMLEKICEDLQKLVASCSPSGKVMEQIGAAFDAGATLIVRSSANVEDLAGLSGAGLYESIANVPASDSNAIGKAVADVWASLYTRRAILSRRAAGVPQHEAEMGILIQEQLEPELSFVLHTSSPLEKDDSMLYAELAVGLGETLASGTRGSPWRLSVEKGSGKVDTLAFANFSQALGRQASKGAVGGFGKTWLDYSKQEMSRSPEKREEIGRCLAKIGTLLEKEFGGAQDVEGAVVGGEFYIVQTRPQP